jgi:tetratricopeptide (TPR) repeat protein
MKLTVCTLFLLSGSIVCAQGMRRVPSSTNSSGSFRPDLLPDASLPSVSVGPGVAPGSSLPSGSISVDQLQIPAKAVKELQIAKKDIAIGNLQGSVDHLEKALRIYPQFAEGHNTLGMQYVHLQQLDKALGEFRTATTINPRLVEAVNNQTALLFILGRLPEAESAARHALDLDPQHKPTRYLLGRILAAENQNTTETLDLLRQSRTDYPPARLVLAQILFKRGQTDEAVCELHGYLDDPNAVEKEKIVHALALLPTGRSSAAAAPARDPGCR